LPLVGGALALLVAGRLAHTYSTRRDARVVPRCRVVVIGAGFGGLNAALVLARSPEIDLTVIDTNNHHLFQPLLYQVATAALSAEDIASPVRDIIPQTHRTRVVMDTVTGIDTAARQVLCVGGSVPYDELVVATGSRSSYFGHDGWACAAPSLKSLDDALELRGRMLATFEQARHAADARARRRLLTFVLIGGGPSGVEMAGSIAELCRETLALQCPAARGSARIVLVEAGDRVLAEFPPDLSRNAAGALRKLGVEIRVGTAVTAIQNGLVHLGDETIEAATIVWTAGTEATSVADWLGVQPGHGGRVPVEPDLRVASQPRIHVIGDAALALDAHGKPLPGLGAVAKQQGHYAGRAILRRVRGLSSLRPFAYRDYGTLATVGRGRAVAEFGSVHLTGPAAWGMWAAAHIFFLIGFRNRVLVSAQWAFEFATNQRPGRLILRRDSGK
jgi:NADH dehydrogenase